MRVAPEMIEPGGDVRCALKTGGTNAYDASAYVWHRSRRTLEHRCCLSAGRACDRRHFQDAHRADRRLQLQQLGAVCLECVEGSRESGREGRRHRRSEDHHRKRRSGAADHPAAELGAGGLQCHRHRCRLADRAQRRDQGCVRRRHRRGCLRLARDRTLRDQAQCRLSRLRRSGNRVHGENARWKGQYP